MSMENDIKLEYLLEENRQLWNYIKKLKRQMKKIKRDLNRLLKEVK